MSNIKELIRQEIERRKKILEESTYYLDNLQQALGYSFVLDDFKEFIDSLPEETPSYVTDSPGDPGNPGEPGISDLEEAAARYERDNRESILSSVDIVDAFVAGAEWHEQQMMKEAVEGVVYRYESYQRIATAIIVDIPREILGNKVKIIIVKEEVKNQK